jgi:hypothetical protein
MRCISAARLAASARCSTSSLWPAPPVMAATLVSTVVPQLMRAVNV